MASIEVQEAVKKMGEEMRVKGIIGSPEQQRISQMRAQWKEQGLVILENCETCGKKLPIHLRQFCSGECMYSSHSAR